MKSMGYNSIVAAVLFCCQCVLAEESFYQQYEKIVATNFSWRTGLHAPSLADTNNTAAKLTNVVIRFDALETNAEIAGIRLGMTTDEVVARWGKPRGVGCSTPAGPVFMYADASLRFKTNALDFVRIPKTAQFDHGLRGNSSLDEWVRVLGKPMMRRDDQDGSALAYEFCGVPRTVLYLTFDPAGDAYFSPTIWHDPDVTKWFKPVVP